MAKDQKGQKLSVDKAGLERIESRRVDMGSSGTTWENQASIGKELAKR